MKKIIALIFRNIVLPIGTGFTVSLIIVFGFHYNLFESDAPKNERPLKALQSKMETMFENTYSSLQDKMKTIEHVQ